MNQVGTIRYTSSIGQSIPEDVYLRNEQKRKEMLDKPLRPISELSGCIKDFTGGLTLKEYLAEIREFTGGLTLKEYLAEIREDDGA